MAITKTIDDVQVLAAQIILERVEMGLQDEPPLAREYAAAKRIPGTDLYEVTLDEEPA